MDHKIQQRMDREIQKQTYRSLKSSAIIATTMLALYSVFLLTLFIIASIPVNEFILYVVGFLVVVALNVLSIVTKWPLKRMRLLGVVNVVFIYTFITYLLFNQNLPGIFANLFIAFTIGFIYLDVRIASINHFLMTLTSSLVLWIFPEILAVEDASITQLSIINASIVVIMMFLFLSALFNIRTKNFNYVKLAKSKENEYRIIDGLFQLQNEVLRDPINLDVFYQDMNAFFETFAEKLDIDNVFEKRLQLIQDLETLSPSKIKKKYKDIPEEIINELRALTFSSHQKIRYLAYRISQSNSGLKPLVDPQDAFNSFRHYDDSETVKILVFSAFYIYFRHEDVDRSAMSHDTFVKHLEKSGLDKLVEPKILKSFHRYKDVIETIVNDAMQGVEVPL